MINSSLKKIPSKSQIILKGDGRLEEYSHDMGYVGDPDALVRPRDIQELKEIVKYCHKEKIPVTCCGSRTGLTGSGIAPRGLSLSMENIPEQFEIGIDPKTKRPVAKVSPSMILEEFQEKVADAGYFYPPDPTSRGEAQIGGTVATNASGADALLYGSTRCYIRGLKVLLANGEEKILERSPESHPTHEKNKGGYLLNNESIDLFIGSEGTLGITIEITCDLLPRSPDHFSAFLFFPSLMSAVSFTATVLKDKKMSPRALEIFDGKTLAIVSTHSKSPPIPQNAKAAIFLKQEYRDIPDRDKKISDWLFVQEKYLKTEGRNLVDGSWVGLDESKNKLFREFRHWVPECINIELVGKLKKGGGKTSTDWWVPWQKIEEMMEFAIRESEALGLTYLVFAHIGCGHPHINHIFKNTGEKTRAFNLLARMCKKAVSLGGGVAGEHGIGKIYRHLLPIQYPNTVIKKMLAIKKSYDPCLLLGPGTIFS